jgi:protocatechuate 3,4-dioxygenase beta subunit
MHHDDFGGLGRDLLATGAAIRRRDVLRLAFGAGALTILGCSADDATAPGASNGLCSLIPSETAGPFPGDGSNGPNVLNQSGVVRADIRSSFGGLSGTAAGVPLTVVLNLQTANTCAAKAGAAVYLWHCDRDGLYSLYSAGATNQNYLRGVQAADANGQVRFTTIYPGCYAGRWPHIHFEVFENLAAATAVGNKIATSQLALPAATNSAVYATTGYAASVTNLAGVSLQNDNIFGEDDGARQLAAMSGDVAAGLVATLTVPV